MPGALSAAVRAPGWAFALGLDAVAALGGHATLRWGPTHAVGIAVTAAAVLIATATASLSDDAMVDLSCTSPLTLRRRTVARLALGLLVAATACATVLAALVGTLPREALEAPAASMVLVVAVGTATGVAAARIRPDVPAAIPAAIVLVAGELCAAQVTLPAAVLALGVVADAWTRTAGVVLVAAAVVILMTRDRGARARSMTVISSRLAD